MNRGKKQFRFSAAAVIAPCTFTCRTDKGAVPLTSFQVLYNKDRLHHTIHLTVSRLCWEVLPLHLIYTALKSKLQIGTKGYFKRILYDRQTQSGV